MSALLTVTGVSKRFDGVQAVSDVSLTVDDGAIVSLIGPNGAGKTTLFNVLTGLYKPSAGRIAFAGRDITGRRPDRITHDGIARTFQNIRLLGTMTALENVVVGRHSRMRAGILRSVLRPPGVRREERDARRRACQLLAFVGLPEDSWHQPALELSYGDRRRVEIARALASEPRLFLLDEPTAGMNPSESAGLVDFMLRLRSELGLTIVLVEHDMKVVMRVSDRLVVLDHGTKIAEGDPAAVRDDPRVIEAYLGKPMGGSHAAA